jgi:hypothetical protein
MSQTSQETRQPQEIIESVQEKISVLIECSKKWLEKFLPKAFLYAGVFYPKKRQFNYPVATFSYYEI